VSAGRPPVAATIGLPPEETVRAFEARDTLRATVRWSEMWHADHARAFTVAKVAKLDMLGEIQASLADVIANGGTLEQWKANLIPYLQSKGWWGDVADRELTGTDEIVRVGPHRLRTIYDTNLRVSRAAGRWERIQQLKVQRPFLRYVAVLDARTRPAHRAWHGTILPVDHPWWDTHYPPCGWYCRCTVRQLSHRDLDAKGWAVTALPPEGPPQMFFPAGRSTPVEVPAGISPGFGYNPGKASMVGAVDKATWSIESAADTDIAAARESLDALVQSDALPQALAEANTRFPVMVLPSKIVADALHRVVTMSGAIGSGLLATGDAVAADGANAIGLKELRHLPAIGASPDHALITNDGKVTLVQKVGDRYLAADIAPVDPAKAPLPVLRQDQPEPSPIRSGAVDSPDEARSRRLIFLRQPFPWMLLVLRWMEGEELGELLASLDDLLS